MPSVLDGCIIAADKGIEKLNKNGVTPNVLIGDFDSLGFVPKGENVIKLPEVKDVTDIKAAVDYGFKNYCNLFYIFGGFGASPDHTFANYQILSEIAQNGGKGFLFGDGFCATVIKNSKIAFQKNSGGFVSVFSLSEKSSGVTEKGLKYCLEDAELSRNFPLGVRNEFLNECAEISVKNGSLLIIWEQTEEQFFKAQPLID